MVIYALSKAVIVFIYLILMVFYFSYELAWYERGLSMSMKTCT